MSSHGVVVDHKESGVRYAVSDRNLNEKIHTYVRDLKPGESVHSFTPKRKGQIVEQDEELDIPEDYSDKAWTVENLNLEIDERNESRDEGDQIVPEGTKKHDLIAALMADDEKVGG